MVIFGPEMTILILSRAGSSLSNRSVEVAEASEAAEANEAAEFLRPQNHTEDFKVILVLDFSFNFIFGISFFWVKS